MSFLILFALLFIGAFINACFSCFLAMCFGDHDIFKDWLPFLRHTIGEDSFWYNPLGGCITCSNVWHGLITFPIWVLFIYLFGLGSNLYYLGWWLAPLLIPILLAYIVISSFFVRKISKD